MVRHPVWIGTSWKMNKTIAEATAYADRLVAAPVPPEVQVFLLPAHTALRSVSDRLPPDSPILLGAQNAHWATEGAATGEISMGMVEDAGASIVEIGHSERREQFGESDTVVARKVRSAVDHGLLALLCVGEPADVRQSGAQDGFVAAQLRNAIAALAADEFDRLLVAYEPVWAIGAGGRPAEVEEVAPVLDVIAEVVAERSSTGRCRAVLYGGGVDTGNASELLVGTSAAGLFVGRAAWDVDGFLELIGIAAGHAAGQATQ